MDHVEQTIEQFERRIAKDKWVVNQLLQFSGKPPRYDDGQPPGPEPTPQGADPPAAPRKQRKQQTQRKARKPREPRKGGLLDRYRKDAVAYIEKHGPARQSTIAKAVGIPRGSCPMVFRNPKDDTFVINEEEQLVCLADEQAKSAPIESQPNRKAGRPPKQRQQLNEKASMDLLKRILGESHPLSLIELERETGVSSGYLSKLLDDESIFEKTPAGYWVV